MIVRSVNAVSLARICGVIYGIIGLIAALPMGCVIMFVPMGDDPGLDFLRGFGVFIILIYPIIFAIAGFISGWLYAMLYNVVAGRIGGIELEVDVDSPSVTFD